METRTLETLCLFLLIVVTFFAGLAKRLKIPYPILLVITGLVISFIPHVPRIPLDPDLIFLIFLPPLLSAAAWLSDWRDFRRNIYTIAMLAIGLVGFTVIGIAYFADNFITALDFRSGLLLGAAVAATDAIAATSIASALGLAPRIASILEGESLVNDATGLLALEFGIALLMGTRTLSVGEGLLRLLWLMAGGIGIGLLLGYLMTFIERFVSDGPLEMAVSLIVPYVAYIASEEIHASGVLAVVACGLFLSRRSTTYLSPSARIQIRSAWQSLDFILNGVVFVLIGLQLPYVLAAIHEYSAGTLLLYGFVFSLVLVALRLLWVFPSAYFIPWVRRRLLHQNVSMPPAKWVFIIGWTGMRGVLALAAAFSIPDTLSNGQPYTQRNLILFLTFSIILFTLVVQGLSLPLLIRRLGLAGNTELEEEELLARRKVLAEAIVALQAQNSSSTEETHDIDDLLHRYKHRLEAITPGSEATGETAPFTERHKRRSLLLRDTAAVERRTLLQLRDEGSIGDEVLRRIERELDLTETRYEGRG